MSRLVFLLVCLVGLVCVQNATSASPEDSIREAAKARLEVARQGLALVDRDPEGMGAVDYADIWVWSERVLKAELTVITKKSERIAALEAHLKRAVRLERGALRDFNSGGISRRIVLEAKYRRCDIELQLAQEKAKPESPRK